MIGGGVCCTREQLPLLSGAEPLGHSGVPLKSPLPPCETIGPPDCLISRPHTFTCGLQLYSPYLLIVQWVHHDSNMTLRYKMSYQQSRYNNNGHERQQDPYCSDWRLP